MRIPNLVYAESINNNPPKVLIHHNWYVAKPAGPYGVSLGRRLQLAFNVLIGRYDAIRYQEDMGLPHYDNTRTPQ